MKTRKYVPVFSSKHLSYIRACRKNMYNIAEGAVRAGKTVDNVFAFCTELETCPDKIHLASASTSPTAKLNIGDCNGMGIEAQFRGRCTWGKYRGNDCIRVRTKTGEKIVIFAGAGKADSFKRIRGNSYGMWIATEVNLHHESFIQEAFNRTAAAKLRKFFWDLNPSAPNSPIYEKYIDLYRIKQKRGELPGGCNYELFLMRDNATISDERFAEIVAQYDPQSVWYKRDIEGKRVSAEGILLQHIAVADTRDGGGIKPYTQDVPYAARTAYLQTIRQDIYEDFGGFDTKAISASNQTATAINSAYQPLDENADDFENQLESCIRSILGLIGIDDVPVFKRNRISNQLEQVQMLMLEATYLDRQTILENLPNIYIDKVPEIMARLDEETEGRFVREESEEETT